VHSTSSGHPVIDVSEFEQVDQTNYPTVFHVSQATSSTAPTSKFRRNKLPPLSPELYQSGPCMVEHNDWDHQKQIREQLDEDNSPKADNVNHVQEESVQESYDHDQHDDAYDEPDTDASVDISEETSGDRTVTKGVARKLRRTLDALQVLVSSPPAVKKKILEICTWTEQITKVARDRGWEALLSVSLETGYDLTTSVGRKMTMQVLEEQRPDVVIVAWPCTAWSQMQNINNKTPEYAEALQ